MDPTVRVDISAVESHLYNKVQAILRELGSPDPSHKGMLRWTLHKKMETHPSNIELLVRVLVKELEKVYRTDCKMHVIPLLHTLSYVGIQSGPIPNNLHQRVYDCHRRLLTLPHPYCAVALRNMRSIKLEMTTPGALYQRRVITEQNLKNEHFTLQEKVFVFADPAVFSGPLGAAVRADLEMASLCRGTLTLERTMVLHTLQTALGTSCHSATLVHALEALGEDGAQKYFQEVVQAVEQSIETGAVGHGQYQSRLQHIYWDILTAAKEETDQKAYGGSLCSAPLPMPEIHFHLWGTEEELWNALVTFTLGCGHSSHSFDEENRDKRDSVQSVDSGIERDLNDLDPDRDKEPPPDRSTSATFTRRPGVRNMKPGDKVALIKERMEATPGSTPVLMGGRSHTARIVVMGDDRVLGRLAKAYRSIRERESKHLVLTKKVNLQMYYIPVTDEPVLSSPGSSSPAEGRLCLASLLGRDPWYNCNINSLGAVIPKLAETHSNQSSPSERNIFLLDVLSYYLRCGTQPVHLPLYSVKIILSSCHVTPVVEEVFVAHLHADFPEFRQLKEKSLGGSSIHPKRNPVKIVGAVISVKYKKVSLSKRGVVRGTALMTCGVVITTVSSIETGGLDLLTVNIDTTHPEYCREIRTQNISIRTLEEKTFTVCLDKDSRRTYKNVQSIEISPCLDPVYSIHQSGQSKSGIRDEQEVGLSKYLSKILSLPINTFTGVTP